MAAIQRLQDRLRDAASTAWLDVDLTLPQVKVLMVLSARGTSRMRDLVRALGALPSTATGIVDRLVERGLVERAADPADRRVVLAGLTARGAETVARVEALTNDRMRELLGTLPPADLAVVASAMERLADAAEAAWPEPPA